MPANKIFLDTAYAIALSAVTDQYHEKAKILAGQIENSDTSLVTTRAVVLEIGNALARLPYRNAAIELLDSLEQDKNVEIVPLTEELYGMAMKLYRERSDKEWGITDCISFVVMQDLGLVEALTTDEHFKQAGFRSLLIE